MNNLTVTALQSVRLSADEAARNGHNCIDPNSLLVGLLSQQNSPALRLLRSLKVNKRALLNEVSTTEATSETTLPSYSMTELSELEITAESQQVLDFAAKYAKESGNNCGTEHILLGLLAYHGTRANAALVRSGATLELVSAALDKLMNGDFIWDDSSTGG